MKQRDMLKDPLSKPCSTLQLIITIRIITDISYVVDTTLCSPDPVRVYSF